jgi:hypothetical protein
MTPQIRVTALVPRIAMFLSMLILIIYLIHFVLPSGSTTESGDIALNPAIQIGLFVTLGLFGALIGFWITFGDLVNRGEK